MIFSLSKSISSKTNFLLLSALEFSRDARERSKFYRYNRDNFPTLLFDPFNLCPIDPPWLFPSCVTTLVEIEREGKRGGNKRNRDSQERILLQAFRIVCPQISLNFEANTSSSTGLSFVSLLFLLFFFFIRKRRSSICGKSSR